MTTYTKKEKARNAEKAWAELVLIAEKRDTIYYGELGEKIDITNSQEVSYAALTLIQNYCLDPDNKIPHLTSLAVNSGTEEVGSGFITKSGSPEKDRKMVYAFDWKDHLNPGYDVFLKYADVRDKKVTRRNTKPMSYSEQVEWCILAVKGWKVLIAHAKEQKGKPKGERKPLTYEQFGSNSEINLHSTKVGEVLRPIQSYIYENILHRLNSLVVRSKDQLPGQEYKRSPIIGSLIKFNVDKTQNDVYDFDWDSIPIPSCSDFMDAYNPDV